MLKPELKHSVGACHRPALSEGQKREQREGDEKTAGKSKNPEEELSKIVGTALRVISIIILIIDAILLNMPDKDLGTIAVLLIVGICMIIAGHILSYLPQEAEKKDRKREQNRERR